MFTFLKKLFGADSKTMADAGVQIEQVPYKVETPVVEAAPAAKVDAPAPTPAPAKKKRYYAKKAPSTAKKATPKKEVAKSAPVKQPSRKPKAK
jgi:hypothetical protein